MKIMNISLIGPKLEDYDHKTEEKVFLDDKNKADSVVDEQLENLQKMFQKNPSKVKSPQKDEKSQIMGINSLKEPLSPSKMINSKKHAGNLFKILKKAKKISENVKNILYYKNIRNMTHFQKSILNDPTDFTQGKILIFKKLGFSRKLWFKPLNACSSIFQKLFYLNKKIIYSVKNKFRPINPNIKTMKIWNIFVVILTFLNFFLFTLEMCFFGGEYNEILFSSYSIIKFLKITNFFCYGFDIFLNFFAGYHVGGALVMKLKLIQKKYLSSLFWFDFIAYIPIILFWVEEDLFRITKNSNIMNILFFFILQKYKLKLKDFKEFIIQEEESFENWFSIAVLYLRTLFVSHLLACLWYIVGIYSNESTSWVRTYNSIDNSWSSMYLNSIYWSMVTMITVGYGDIVPQNEIEKMFCIITMLVGFTLFGFTMGSFGDIIRQMNAKNQNLEYVSY